MAIEDEFEKVAALTCNDLEQLLEGFDCLPSDGIPINERKQLVELCYRRFEYFYDLGLKWKK